MATDRPNDSKQTTNATPPPTRSADSAAVAAEPAKRSAFGHTFWMLNSIEMFERLAYFGIRAVVPIYIMQATEPGGLHMTAVHKGIIYAWWAILQSWLPMFTGGIADRYGYKRVLFYSISANAVGYVMMAYLHSYAGFFVSIMVLATGTAFFKPALQGSIAQNLTKQNSSLGWGVFYWVVNIGAMTAPLLATALLGKPHSAEGWRNLFLASAAYTLCNLLLLLTFKDVPSGADKTERLGTVFLADAGEHLALLVPRRRDRLVAERAGVGGAVGRVRDGGVQSAGGIDGGAVGRRRTGAGGGPDPDVLAARWGVPLAAALAGVSADHVLLLDDDVPAVGSASELHRRLDRQLRPRPGDQLGFHAGVRRSRPAPRAATDHPHRVQLAADHSADHPALLAGA